jgi:hypothetical protein
MGLADAHLFLHPWAFLLAQGIKNTSEMPMPMWEAFLPDFLQATFLTPETDHCKIPPNTICRKMTENRRKSKSTMVEQSTSTAF